MEITDFAEIISGDNSYMRNSLLKKFNDFLVNVDNTNLKKSSVSIIELKQRLDLFNEKFEFEKGDIVSWKDGLKNRTVPEYGQPAVVVEVLESSIFSSSDENGSPFFREPLNFVIGLIDEDNEFHCFHVDKRRFKKIVDNNI